jgi:acetoin utilization protein AcuB
MLVRDIMQTTLVTITPATTLPEAIRLAKHRGIRHLPVLEDGRLVGIVSDRDLKRAMASPATSLETRELLYLLERLQVEEIMTRAVITVGPDASIGSAARLMVQEKIGALPVTEGERLVGLITETDVLRLVVDRLDPVEPRPGGAPAPAPVAAPGATSATPRSPRRILVPLDGSTLAEAALPRAADLARRSGAGLYLLRAVEVATFPGVDPTEAQVRAVREAEGYLADVQQRLVKAGHADVETSAWYGPAAYAIVEAARTRDVDQIVMTTHGRSGLGRLVLGSVAESVLRGTTTPVLLLRVEGAPVEAPPGPGSAGAGAATAGGAGPRSPR